MRATPSLSVVVPCFNESACLAPLHARLSAVCQAVAPGQYEIVLVDDGSRDDSWARITALCADDPHCLGLKLSRNHGHQLALSAGLAAASGARVLVIDADLQDPPELLPQMMALMDGGAHVVYGQRQERAGETAFKRWTAAAFYRLFGRLAAIDMPLDTGDFRLMSRQALDVLLAMPERQRFLRGMVSWIGLTQVPLAYSRAARAAGTSHYPLRKMIGFGLDAITSFSIVPLRLASHLGLAFGLGGLALMLFVLHSWFTGQTIQGWTSVVLVILILGSAQLIVLGIFGEYLGRLVIESKQRPLYVIEEIAGPRAGDKPG